MICPPDCFTPKSLEKAFAKSLGQLFVRNSVFASAKQLLDKVPEGQLDIPLQTAAGIFLHHFIEQNNHEACVYDQTSNVLRNIDEWVLRVRSNLPNMLPTTDKQAAATEKLLASRFLFFDQEFWVLDCERLASISAQDRAAHRVSKLIQGLDGYSLCFPRRIYPTDLGETMNFFAKRIAAQDTVVTKPKLGRPTKLDRVAAILERNFPDGVKGVNQWEVLRTVEKELGDSIGITSLRKAIKNTNSAHV